MQTPLAALFRSSYISSSGSGSGSGSSDSSSDCSNPRDLTSIAGYRCSKQRPGRCRAFSSRALCNRHIPKVQECRVRYGVNCSEAGLHLCSHAQSTRAVRVLPVQISPGDDSMNFRISRILCPSELNSRSSWGLHANGVPYFDVGQHGIEVIGQTTLLTSVIGRNGGGAVLMLVPFVTPTVYTALA